MPSEESGVGAVAAAAAGRAGAAGPVFPAARAAWEALATTLASSYFLLRRWTRVRRSSLRCFFFAIRLRRFLITEPIDETSR